MNTVDSYFGLQEYAHRMLAIHPSAQQVIVLQTDGGTILECASDNIVNGDYSAEVKMLTALERDGGTVVRILCLWDSGCVDIPSMHLRSALAEKHGDAHILVRTSAGLASRSLSSTLP